ncbi:MAG: translation initiation factor IF-2 [Planctomycetaceae bacterium]|nr:translation initiation factor IF-2 [Planctomycetaceae bacterium]
MSIRIYALAQQLKVETKALVDAMKSMGIDGKGSPLASLTEEEVKIVKANFQKKAPKPSSSGSPTTSDGQLQRPVLPADAVAKKIPVIGLSQGTRKKDDQQKDTKDTTESATSQKEHTKTPDTNTAKHPEHTAKSTTATSTATADKSVDAAKSAPAKKPAVAHTQTDTTEKKRNTPTTKESEPVESTASHKDKDKSSQSAHNKSQDHGKPKESAQKNSEHAKTPPTPPKTAPVTADHKQSTETSPKPDSSQSHIQQVGKIAEQKSMPQLPPAIGHIDITAFSGTNNKSNQHRGGGKSGSKQFGNRDSKNRSNSPLDNYRKKGGSGKPQQQQQQQNSGSQKPQNQQQQKQSQNQNQPQRQPQDQKRNDNRQVQPLKKSPIATFNHGTEALTRDSYIMQRNAVDNKVPDLDGKRKRVDGNIENKSDNKTPQQDSSKQQIGQNAKKTQAVNISLAPIPTTKTKRQPKEPLAQRPDKRLPADVIRTAVTSGSGTSVDEFIRKHKDRQQENKDDSRRPRGTGTGTGTGRRDDQRRDRGGLPHNRERDRERNRDHDRVGGTPVARPLDRTDKREGDDRGGFRGDDRNRPRIDRDRSKHRGGSHTGSAGAPQGDGAFVDAGASWRIGRESSRIAEEKRRIRVKKRSRHSGEYEDDSSMNTPRQLRRVKSRNGKAVSTAAPRKNNLIIHLPCTVKQFAEQTGTTLAIVIKKLLELKVQMQLNSQLDVEAVELLAEALGIQVQIKENVSLEDRLVTTLFEQEDDPDSVQPRPPVVTVLGHVDHGKTTMLDNILKLNVVSGEKGGITQHIRAYRVKMENGSDITFVDTPGHEAFTEMRARGAGCTDIAILVVAADDGVMPQTEEAISHAKAAGVPIIVAINKIDLPGVNPDRVLQELAANDLIPEEWGGDVPVVRCSGLTGLGLDKLLETIQVMAEILELRANPDRTAIGVALEAELQSGQGAVCKVIVQKGTLRAGDVVLCGTAYGRVKAMYDTLDTKKQVLEATPSTPVNLVGLDVAPGAGSRFCVLEDVSDARMIAEQRQVELRKNELAEVQAHVTLETLFQRIKDSHTVQTLNVIIRADVRGSIEAIRKELDKLSHPEVKIKVLQATVGGISEADVHLADASDAIIVGFNVVPDENARVMAERKKIQVRRYDIIYNLTNDIKKALEGMLKPVEHVKELGRAMVQQVFVISRIGAIAGCRVISGNIERDCKVRVIRESRIIGEYPLDSLKREKDDVKEVREGYECGMKLKGFNDLKEGDILETYKIESVARTF